MGSGMEVVDGMHAGQRWGHMSGDAGALTECKVIHR